MRFHSGRRPFRPCSHTFRETVCDEFFWSDAWTNFEQAKGGPIFVTRDLRSSEAGDHDAVVMRVPRTSCVGYRNARRDCEIARKLDGITYHRGT